MGEQARREIRITLKGDTDSMDEVEELLREALSTARDDFEVKTTYTLSKEVELDEDGPAEDAEEEDFEDDEDAEDADDE